MTNSDIVLICTDVFVASRSEPELTAMHNRLMENVYHVSGALSAMEQAIKGDAAAAAAGGADRRLSSASGVAMPAALVRITDNIVTTL